MPKRSKKPSKSSGKKGIQKAGHHYTPPVNKLLRRDKAREARVGKPEGKGTGRSESSNKALLRILRARGRHV